MSMPRLPRTARGALPAAVLALGAVALGAVALGATAAAACDFPASPLR
jgi:hypothetical protein